MGLFDPSLWDILRKVLERARGRGGVKLPPLEPTIIIVQMLERARGRGGGESMEVVVGVLTTCLIIRKRQWHSIYLSLSKISFYNLKLNLSVLQTTISIAFYEPSHYKFIYKRRYFTF